MRPTRWRTRNNPLETLGADAAAKACVGPLS